MTDLVFYLKVAAWGVLIVVIVMSGLHLLLGSAGGTTYRPQGDPKNPVTPSLPKGQRPPLRLVDTYDPEQRFVPPLDIDPTFWLSSCWRCGYCGQLNRGKGTCSNCGASREG